MTSPLNEQPLNLNNENMEMKMHLTLLFLLAVAVVVLACLDSAEAAKRKEDVVFDHRGNPTRVSKEGKAKRRLSITDVNEHNIDLTLRRYCLLLASPVINSSHSPQQKPGAAAWILHAGRQGAHLHAHRRT